MNSQKQANNNSCFLFKTNKTKLFVLFLEFAASKRKRQIWI